MYITWNFYIKNIIRGLVICFILLVTPISLIADDVSNYISAAESGDAAAQFTVGCYYYLGKYVPKDYEQAVYWFRKSAEQGDAHGQCYLGVCYLYGEGIQKDDNQAVYWIRKSAEQGHAHGQCYLGVCYRKGIGVSKDSKQAVYWFSKSAEQGDADAQVWLGICYYQGEGVSKDCKQAVYWYRKSAEQGDADAQVWLGICYYQGEGVSEDYKQAVHWFSKSAEQGDADAQVWLGICYYQGEGVSKDCKQAVYWFRKSADQGNAAAQQLLGSCYYQGEGVSEDYKQAVHWFSKSAEQGNVNGQNNLGYCYYKGNGVTKDYRQAIYWYSKSVEQGDTWATNMLAYCYAGLGDFDMAHNTIDKLIQQEPDSVAWVDSKGEFYIMQNDFPKAWEMWSKIIKVSPNYGDKKTALYTALFAGDNVDSEIPQSKASSTDVFAIIIANENYKQEANVAYAGNDGDVVYKYFTQALGIPEKHIKYVKDASLNDIKYNINWLGKIAVAYNGEAKALVYYAGHGIPDESNANAYLLPSDGYGSDVSTGYKISDLYSKLASMPLKSVVLFMDACFSGANRSGDMMVSARGVAIKAKNGTPSGNLVVFSAAQGDETAYANQKSQHGMFTHYFLKKIKESKGDATLDELSSYIISNVRKESIVENGKSQTPCVVASPLVADKWRSWTLK